MPKAVPLTPDIMAAPQPAPQAATSARAGSVAELKKVTKQHVPLQVRVPRDQAKAIRIAAREREQNLGEFMLACFHAYMESGKHG